MPTLEELFPVTMQERPVRFEAPETNPANLLEAEIRRLSTQNRDTLDGLLAGVATEWFQLRRLIELLSDDVDDSVRDGLTIAYENLKERLSAFHVEVIDLTGQTFDEQAEAVADVRGHSRNEELSEPTVVHVTAPTVKRDGRLIARGAILVEAPSRQ